MKISIVPFDEFTNLDEAFAEENHETADAALNARVCTKF